MHLSEEEILSLLDAEHALTVRSAAREHAESCAECRSRIRDAVADDAWVAERLRLLDHVAPPVTLRDLVAGRRKAAWGRIAAGFILVAALGGAAYALPGSPLQRLVARVVGLVSPTHDTPPQPLASRAGSQAGIAVDPGQQFVIQVGSAANRGTALVSLSDGPELVVRAPGGRPSFSSEVDRLVVEHPAELLSLESEVPRGAPSVELRWGSRRLWRKEGSRITSDVPVDPKGRYRFSISPSGH
jgi:hypothetical protein